MIWRRRSLWSGQNKYRTALNGRILSRRPRLYQSCSAIEEEELKPRELKLLLTRVCSVIIIHMHIQSYNTLLYLHLYRYWLHFFNPVYRCSPVKTDVYCLNEHTITTGLLATLQHEERVKLPSGGTEILLSPTCCLY